MSHLNFVITNFIHLETGQLYKCNNYTVSCVLHKPLVGSSSTIRCIVAIQCIQTATWAHLHSMFMQVVFQTGSEAQRILVHLCFLCTCCHSKDTAELLRFLPVESERKPIGREQQSPITVTCFVLSSGRTSLMLTFPHIPEGRRHVHFVNSGTSFLTL